MNIQASRIPRYQEHTSPLIFSVNLRYFQNCFVLKHITTVVMYIYVIYEYLLLFVIVKYF